MNFISLVNRAVRLPISIFSEGESKASDGKANVAVKMERKDPDAKSLSRDADVTEEPNALRGEETPMSDSNSQSPFRSSVSEERRRRAEFESSNGKLGLEQALVEADRSQLFSQKLSHHFSSASRQVKAGLVVTSRLANFSEDVRKLYFKFGASLHALAQKELAAMRKVHPRDEMESSRESLLQLIEHYVTMADAFRTLSDDVQSSLVQPLTKHFEFASSQRKAARDTEKVASQDRLRAISDMKSLQRKAHRLISQDANSASSHDATESLKFGDRRGRSIRSTIRSKFSKNNVLQACMNYNEAVDKANSIQRRYMNTIVPESLSQLQEVEQRRMEALQSHMVQVRTIHEKLTKKLEEVNLGIGLSTFSVQPHGDMKNFVDNALLERPTLSQTEEFTYDLSKNVVELEVEEKIRAHGSKSTEGGGLFGGNLEQIMSLSQNKGLKVPRLVSSICELMVSSGGIKVDGLFRMAASYDEVRALKVQLMQGNYKISPSTSAHTLSNMLKLFLRDLTCPVLPEDLYEECVKFAREVQNKDDSENEAELKRLFLKVPSINQHLLMYLAKFLESVAAHEDKNRMGLKNLAIVFSPGLLRSSCSDPLSVFKNSQLEAGFVNYFLEHYKLVEPLVDSVPTSESSKATPAAADLESSSSSRASRFDSSKLQSPAAEFTVDLCLPRSKSPSTSVESIVHTSDDSDASYDSNNESFEFSVSSEDMWDGIASPSQTARVFVPHSPSISRLQGDSTPSKFDSPHIRPLDLDAGAPTASPRPSLLRPSSDSLSLSKPTKKPKWVSRCVTPSAHATAKEKLAKYNKRSQETDKLASTSFSLRRKSTGDVLNPEKFPKRILTSPATTPRPSRRPATTPRPSRRPATTPRPSRRQKPSPLIVDTSSTHNSLSSPENSYTHLRAKSEVPSSERHTTSSNSYMRDAQRELVKHAQARRKSELLPELRTNAQGTLNVSKTTNSSNFRRGSLRISPSVAGASDTHGRQDGYNTLPANYGRSSSNSKHRKRRSLYSIFTPPSQRKEREVRDKAAEDDDDDVVLDEAGLSTRDLFKNVAAEHEVTLSRSSLNTPSARRRSSHSARLSSKSMNFTTRISPPSLNLTKPSTPPSSSSHRHASPVLSPSFSASPTAMGMRSLTMSRVRTRRNTPHPCPRPSLKGAFSSAEPTQSS